MNPRSFNLFAMAAACALAGCGTVPQAVPATKAVPVECKEQVPDRPAMPTETLPADSKVDPYVQAAAAELKIREGYETKLRTSLEACTAPIQPSP